MTTREQLLSEVLAERDRLSVDLAAQNLEMAGLCSERDRLAATEQELKICKQIKDDYAAHRDTLRSRVVRLEQAIRAAQHDLRGDVSLHRLDDIEGYPGLLALVKLATEEGE